MKHQTQILERNMEIVFSRYFGNVGMTGRNEIGLQGFASRCSGEIAAKVDNGSLKAGHGKIK
jgi:hypothetical protein